MMKHEMFNVREIVLVSCSERDCKLETKALYSLQSKWRNEESVLRETREFPCLKGQLIEYFRVDYFRSETSAIT